MIVPFIRLHQYEPHTFSQPERRCNCQPFEPKFLVGPNPALGSFEFCAPESGIYQFGPWGWSLNAGDTLSFDSVTQQALYNKTIDIGTWAVRI